MKRTSAFFVAAVLIGIASPHARAQNTLTLGATSSAGNPPWVINGSGEVGLDASDKSYDGSSFYVVDPNGKQINGTVNFPKGKPSPGNTVPYTGKVIDLTVKGDYTVYMKVNYTDSGGNKKVLKLQITVTVPSG